MRWGIPLLALTLLLGGCGDFLTRLSEVGGPPRLTPSGDPTKDPKFGQPVSLPMPAPVPAHVQASSLWRPGGRTFFKDQRAAAIGDVLTIVVNMNDAAWLINNSSVSRNGNEGMDVPNLFGLEHAIPASLVNTGSSNSNITTGQIQRTDQLTTSVAAVVTQVLPNGNLVVVGRQQIRVNSELRELVVSGIVRPQDIASDNTVQHYRLAEARIIYGGRGQLSDQQVPRYGQQLLDVLLPF
jgi:flagellar L-ring protein precursor FlgH